MPTRPLPHDPYANAVMAALNAEGMLNAADSWTDYAEDDGEVMLMEIVIALDTDRAEKAGWTHGALLKWSQTRGWEWGPGTDGALLQYVQDLATGPVPDPDSIVRAARLILAGQSDASTLPVTGAHRPPAQTISPLLQTALDAGDIDLDMAQDLSAYA
ncbi:hypothetical protein [Streptomyces microflavus]|uniref:hypothetical protein n=1 Tax=Streptomyces microflavus TaxID=1919 RepID=UPI00386DD20C|nr:DUF6292 family protein [Streptomyces microflavus]